MVSRNRISRVRIDTAGNVGSRVTVAVEISWISRCPAVKLAVSRTPRARGRISRLIVSIMIRAGISGVGVPSGSKCPREIDGWFRSPIRSVASHSGKARARFIDSCVVGVNVYGRSPRRLVSSRKIISDVRIIAHLCPFLSNGIISCFVIALTNHSWMVVTRLLTHRLFGDGSKRAGNVIAIRTSGIPSSDGLENWSKKLRFMVRFMGRCL